MSDKNKRDHIHVVIKTDGVQGSSTTLTKLIDTAIQLTSRTNVHVIVSASNAKLAPQLPADNVIVEPVARGKSAAIAYAGCHLYRKDPTAVMVLVNCEPQAALILLERNFETLLKAVDEPGSLVTLADASNQSTGIFAWSIYALMETFRNHCPRDFPVINEIARTWSHSPETSARLYSKLACEDIATRLLRKVHPGYPTRNVTVTAETPIAPVRGGGISDQPVIADLP